MTEIYKESIWLNKNDSPSTGSVVAYDGPSPWDDQPQVTFLQIASCDTICRLHMTDHDTNDDMIDKLEKLRDVADRFIEHLRAKKEKRM